MSILRSLRYVVTAEHNQLSLYDSDTKTISSLENEKITLTIEVTSTKSEIKRLTYDSPWDHFSLNAEEDVGQFHSHFTGDPEHLSEALGVVSRNFSAHEVKRMAALFGYSSTDSPTQQGIDLSLIAMAVYYCTYKMLTRAGSKIWSQLAFRFNLPLHSCTSDIFDQGVLAYLTYPIRVLCARPAGGSELLLVCLRQVSNFISIWGGFFKAKLKIDTTVVIMDTLDYYSAEIIEAGRRLEHQRQQLEVLMVSITEKLSGDKSAMSDKLISLSNTSSVSMRDTKDTEIRQLQQRLVTLEQRLSQVEKVRVPEPGNPMNLMNSFGGQQLLALLGPKVNMATPVSALGSVALPIQLPPSNSS